MDAAARRTGLENEAANAFLFKLFQFSRGPACQDIRQVFFRFSGEKARPAVVDDKLHRFARHGQPSFDLGADRHPLDESGERVHQVLIQLVPAVIADVVAEEAGADAEFDCFNHNGSDKNAPSA